MFYFNDGINNGVRRHLFANHLKGDLSCVVACPPSSVRTFSDFEIGGDESSPLEIDLGKGLAFIE